MPKYVGVAGIEIEVTDAFLRSKGLPVPSKICLKEKYSMVNLGHGVSFSMPSDCLDNQLSADERVAAQPLVVPNKNGDIWPVGRLLKLDSATVTASPRKPGPKWTWHEEPGQAYVDPGAVQQLVQALGQQVHVDNGPQMYTHGPVTPTPLPRPNSNFLFTEPSFVLTPADYDADHLQVTNESGYIKGRIAGTLGITVIQPAKAVTDTGRWDLLIV
jgi:hypothetical protein